MALWVGQPINEDIYSSLTILIYSHILYHLLGGDYHGPRNINAMPFERYSCQEASRRREERKKKLVNNLTYLGIKVI